MSRTLSLQQRRTFPNLSPRDGGLIVGILNELARALGAVDEREEAKCRRAMN